MLDPAHLPYRKSVGMCLLNQQGLALMAERRERRGAWQMPQGGIHPGEPLNLTVARELREELGTDRATIIGRVPEKLHYEFPDWLQYRNGVFRGKYRGQEQDWFALRFTGADADIDLSGEHEPENPEFIAWQWVPLADTPAMVVAFKQHIYARVATLFQPLAAALARGETPPALVSDPPG